MAFAVRALSPDSISEEMPISFSAFTPSAASLRGSSRMAKRPLAAPPTITTATVFPSLSSVEMRSASSLETVPTSVAKRGAPMNRSFPPTLPCMPRPEIALMLEPGRGFTPSFSA
ncbi:hypothetical protein D3C78_1567030 [compost metagenome]